MKAILHLVAKLGDTISSILAVTSLLPGGWDYNGDSESTPLISVSEANGKRQLYADDDVVLTCAGAPSDKIILQLVGLPTPGLASVLQAIGMGAASWTVEHEALDDRLNAIDHGWQLLRNISLALPTLSIEACVDHAVTLLTFAHKWRSACAVVLNTGSDASEARLAELEAQAMQMTKALSGVISSTTLNYDARGSAMSITFVGRDSPSEVCGHAFDWSPARASLGRAPRQTSVMYQMVPAQKTHALTPSKVDDTVRDLLASAEISGVEVRIHRKLSPALYKRVSSWLEEAGGQWHVGRQAHVFATDPTPMLNQMIHAGVWYTRRDFEFFWTPPAQVAELVASLDLSPGMQVLEPEAGHGAIAMAMAEVVGIENVRCHELMPENVAHLTRLGFSISTAQDFLSVQPEPIHDAIAMNPPFSGGRDIAHVLHAVKFLKPGGRLAAIMSPTWLHADTRKAKAFRQFLSDHQATITKIAAGTFKDAGTNIQTVRIVLKAPEHTDQVFMPSHPGTRPTGVIREASQIEQLSLI